jgi:hypothetical protein
MNDVIDRGVQKPNSSNGGSQWRRRGEIDVRWSLGQCAVKRLRSFAWSQRLIACLYCLRQNFGFVRATASSCSPSEEQRVPAVPAGSRACHQIINSMEGAGSAVSLDDLAARVAACQRHFEFENAQFLAERLHAHEGSASSLLLLATAYFQNGNKLQAWALLRAAPPDCRRHGDIAFLIAKVRACVRGCARAQGAAGAWAVAGDVACSWLLRRWSGISIPAGRDLAGGWLAAPKLLRHKPPTSDSS